MIYIDRTANDLYFDLINKSLDGNSRLDYFKKKLLDILSKKEKEENDGAKRIVKSRVASIGEIREWKGKKFKKMPDKTWVRVYDKRDRHSEISIARLKGKVRRATSVEELFDIVSKNIHRFQDENGRTLDIVTELKNEVDKKKTTINKPKNNTGNKPAVKKEEKPKVDEKTEKWLKTYTPIQEEARKFIAENKGKYVQKPLSDRYAYGWPKIENGEKYSFYGATYKELNALMNNLKVEQYYLSEEILNIKGDNYYHLKELKNSFDLLQKSVDYIKQSDEWIDDIDTFYKEHEKLVDLANDFVYETGELPYVELKGTLFNKYVSLKYHDNVNLDKVNYADLKTLWTKVTRDATRVAQKILDTFTEEGRFDLVDNYAKEFRDCLEMVNKIITAKNWGKETKVKVTGKYKNFDYNTLPDSFKSGDGKSTFVNLGKYLNSFEIKDKRVKSIIQNFGDAVTNFGKQALNIDLHNVATRHNCYYCPGSNRISIPKFADMDKKDNASTIFHEFGHRLDYVFNLTEEDNDIFNIDNEIDSISNSVKERIDTKERKEEIQKIKDDLSKVLDDIMDNPKHLIDNSLINKFNKQRAKALNIIKAKNDIGTGLYDMYDALSGGTLFDTSNVRCGHGSDYYRKDNNRKKKECFANYFQTMIEYPEYMDIIKEDKPKLYNYLESCLDKLYSRFNEAKARNKK